MMRTGTVVRAAVILFAALNVAGAAAADISCEGLVPSGSRMICPGFEPNWAVELLCDGQTMTSTFIDAATGDEITRTPGGVTFTAQDPWEFSTGHGIRGSIAHTPAGCRDESDAEFDFTLTPKAVPGFPEPYYPICCRIE